MAARPFLAWGVAGFAAAAALALILAAGLGLDVGVELLLVGVAVAVFFVLATGTRALIGREALIYYHHEIAVLLAVAATAALLGVPVLSHLDATALGLGAFLALGRLGCLTVGCCHGRTAPWGITYPTAPGPAIAVPAYLRGRRLYPVQALEAGGVAAIVIAGVLLVSEQAPGRALALYVELYAVLRFGLEELRGDWRRPRALGLSEAQWTSLGLAALMVAGRMGGVLEHAPVWPALALLVVATGTLAARRRRGVGLLGPEHVRELRAAVSRSAAASDRAVLVTSQGIRVSAGTTGDLAHVTLSRDGRPLTAPEVRALQDLIGEECLGSAATALVPGPVGAVHVVAGAAGTEAA